MRAGADNTHVLQACGPAQLRQAPLKQNAQKNGPPQSTIITLDSLLNDHDFTELQ